MTAPGQGQVWRGLFSDPSIQEDDAGGELPHSSEAPILLVDYDPAWPAAFEKEREALAEVLREWLTGTIEHIGSTAVPGLRAKPVLDIMAGVGSLAASRPAIQAVASLDYVHFPYRAEVMHWFCKPSPAHRTHHLHLVPFGSPLWNERLRFRDALRSDPALAAAYAGLKRRLADRHRNDREAYTEAKSAFIARALART
jgi:GrpB-like predicted nucleotidyltransferase (UPF0157 family)